MTTEEIMQRPICPVVWVNNAKNQEFVHCDPQCAWFDEDRNQCAVLTLAKAVHRAVGRK